MIVRVDHVRACRLCFSGARKWFAANNLDWRDFLENGLSAEILRATGDPFALQVIAVAEQEASNGR